MGDQEFTVFLQAGLIGCFVNPVHGGPVPVIEMAGHGFIGQEHEFLDQLVGFVGGLFFNPVGSALGVEQDAKFWEIEIEGARGKAASPKGGSKVPGALEEAIQIVAGRTFQSLHRFGVGEPVARKYDGAGEAG